MASDDRELLDFYQRELTYLRRTGVEFARAYPKIARRLELGPDQSADPHVERLIESFAFLAGRIQRNLESEFPRFTAALLGLLYPHLVQPIPALSIAHFDVDAAKGKLTSGFPIARGTQVFAPSEDGLRCRFRTCAPVTLWPVEVTYAAIEATDQYDFPEAHQAAAVLRLTLRAKGAKFSQLDLRSLRFYLHADPILANTLYELIFSRVPRVAYLTGGETPQVLRAEKALEQVGFGPDEAVLPYPPHAHPAYRLVQEYFLFPEKFRFFDLHFPNLDGAGDEIDVLFLLDYMPKQRLFLDRDTFRLGCTPIINLFKRTAEPLRLTHRQSEYRLVGDHRFERITEIHSVLSVSGLEPGRDKRAYAPYFGFDHSRSVRDTGTFWTLRREASPRKDMGGTETYLSFVNLDLDPRQPESETILVEALCTNRLLSEQLQPGAVLKLEQAAPLARITCLLKPTSPRLPAMGGETAWRLVSHLSLNYLSLAEGAESLKALKEILRLYVPPGDVPADEQVQGITSMACRRVVRRVGDDAWRGFCRGIEITLEFDERRYVGSSAFLFSAVLDRFFALYTSINSFTLLQINGPQRGTIWKKWPPRIGSQAVL